MSNILQAFYILFQTDAEKAQRETAGLEHASEKAALSQEALAAASFQAGLAATEAATVMTAAQIEAAASFMQTGAYAAEAGVVTVAAHEAGAAAAGIETAAEVALGEAYKFNRMQRQELIGAGRHMFDQLAAGGSLFTTLTTHAATLAEALANGPGGLGAGMSALAASAGKFVAQWGAPIAVLAGLALTAGVATHAVKDLVADGQAAAKINIDVSDLDALRKTARELGGEAKAVDADLLRFSNRVEGVFGGKSLEGGKDSKIAKTMAAIGVHTRATNGELKDTKTLLLDVAGALEKRSKPKQAEALRNLGITDPGLEKAVTGGRVALEAYIAKQKELGVVTKEQVEIARKYKLATEELGERWRTFRDELAVRVLPVLTAIFDALRGGVEWIRLNSTLVQGFGIAFVIAAGAMSAAMWGGLIPAFTALAIRVLAATWPFVLIAAAILAVGGAFAAIYEDVNFFLKGQPSLLGELVNKYGWVKTAVHAVGAVLQWIGKEGAAAWHTLTEAAKSFGKNVGPALKGVWEVAGPLLRLLLDASVALFKVLAPIAGGFLKVVGGIIREFGSTIVQLVELVTIAFKKAAEIIGPIWNAMFKEWLDNFDKLIAGVRKVSGLRPDSQVDANLAAGRGLMLNAANSNFGAIPPSAWQMRAAGGARHSNVHIGEVNVHTQATDPDGISRGIGSALQSELRRTASTFDNGVER